MAAKESDKLTSKLIIYRVAVLSLIAFLLVHFDIVNDTNGSGDIGLYIFTLIVALPVTMLLDKYIVKFAKKY